MVNMCMCQKYKINISRCNRKFLILIQIRSLLHTTVNQNVLTIRLQQMTASSHFVDYGYFMVSCGDRGTKSVTILEAEAETAVNRFLALIIDKQAYQWVLDIKDREEASWPYHCRYDYRRLWFGKALEWLAPAVDWAFLAQCADRYIGLLNRWFARPHWEYDYQISRIIEISDSREYSDSHYLYRIEPAKEPGRSRIRLEPQFLEDGGAAGTFQFDIDGEALDMRRLDEKVLVLMDREEDNIDAYSLEGISA